MYFITSKKAIPSIKSDFKKMKLDMKLVVKNYESIHKLPIGTPAVLILDEAHRLGKFPKPAKTAKLLHKRFSRVPTILMSGTPSPESHSQLFHQFWVTGTGPWKQFTNFYKFAKKKVDVKKVFIGMGMQKNDYSVTKKEILKEFDKYKVTMTQKDAGFDGKVVEKIHIVKTPKKIQEMLFQLKRTQLYETKKIELMADTAGKLSSYYHQLSSGTVIPVGEEREGLILDLFKVNYIRSTFKGKKVALFYLFKAEGRALKSLFPKWTPNPQEFNKAGYKGVFISQVRSGREGINISSADCLVFINISYSAVDYWQARARTQTRKGGDRQIHWVFSDTGIEQAIYNVVQDKKDFTTKHFNAYVRSTNSKQGSKEIKKSRVQSHKVKISGRSWYTRFARA